MRLYLDTNAVSTCAVQGRQHSLRNLRTDVKAAAHSGGLEFVISLPLLEEPAQISLQNWRRYGAMTEACSLIPDLPFRIETFENFSRFVRSGA